MKSVSVQYTIEATPEDTWKLLAAFDAMHQWHPAVISSEGSGSQIGATRRLDIVNLGYVDETLDKLDPKTMTLEYSALSLPLPVDNYKGVMSVVKNADGHSRVTWQGNFDEQDGNGAVIAEALKGFYTAGLEGLSKKLS